MAGCPATAAATPESSITSLRCSVAPTRAMSTSCGHRLAAEDDGCVRGVVRDGVEDLALGAGVPVLDLDLAVDELERGHDPFGGVEHVEERDAVAAERRLFELHREFDLQARYQVGAAVEPRAAPLEHVVEQHPEVAVGGC